MTGLVIRSMETGRVRELRPNLAYIEFHLPRSAAVVSGWQLFVGEWQR